MQTPDLCLAAVRQNGYALKEVKEQTPEICLEAVKQDGYALSYVQEQTSEICIAAVKQNGLTLTYIPKSEQTLAMALAALRQNPDSRKFLADKFRIPEVYKAVGYDYKSEDLAPSYSETKRERTVPEH